VGGAESGNPLLQSLVVAQLRQGDGVMKLEEVYDLRRPRFLLHCLYGPGREAAHHVALRYHVLQARIALLKSVAGKCKSIASCSPEGHH
jgi:hypothetical protein